MRKIFSLIVLALGAALIFGPAQARPTGPEVRMPRVFGDHMVFQRGKPLVVWGWAAPGEKVTVALNGNKKEAAADATGRWTTVLPVMAAGGPFEMTVAGRTGGLAFKDVLVGDVWLCSGQSNMEWPLRAAENGADVVKAANHPLIRLLNVEQKASPQPLPDIGGAWAVCSPESAGDFSAVGYFFGRNLQADLHVPIGLINSSWGGTLIETWTPPAGFEMTPALSRIVRDLAMADEDYRGLLPGKLAEMEAWIASVRKALERGGAIPLQPGWPEHPIYGQGFPEKPTSLYNGMIHPFVPFALRGAIWYQGESNVITKDGMLYYEKMKALVNGWRKLWGQGDFPFYFVEIAPLGGPTYEDDELPKLWDAQRASLAIPNTGMAVVNDVGNLEDIHPWNKLTVGNRLALWALAKEYGRKDVVFSGPLYRSMGIRDGKAVISFDDTGGGLDVRGGGELTWFEIAGEDRVFKKAAARIEGNTVVVWSEAVPTPAAVRFGWNKKAEPNLMNKEGLPASPFRTDSW